MVSLKISQLIRGEGCTSFHAIGDDRRRGKFLLDALFAIKTHFLREIQCCAGDEAQMMSILRDEIAVTGKFASTYQTVVRMKHFSKLN